MAKRIGIFAGSFNPIHSGHIKFALQSLNIANLDLIYFIPERRPRFKKSLEHYGHRVAMINQALKPHPKLKLLEFVDPSLSINRTLPKIKAFFPNDKIILIVGSDLVRHMLDWPDLEKLIYQTELVVGLRREDSEKDIEKIIYRWSQKPKNLIIINSIAKKVSSSEVRNALRNRIYVNGLLKSVEKYSNKQWLYISFLTNKINKKI